MVQQPQQKPQIVGRRCVPSEYSPTWLTTTNMQVERRLSHSLSPCVERRSSLSPRVGRRPVAYPDGKTSPCQHARGRNRLDVDVFPSRASPLLYVTTDNARTSHDTVSPSSSTSSLSSDRSSSPSAGKENGDIGLPGVAASRPASLLRRQSLPLVHLDSPSRAAGKNGRPRSNSIVGGQCCRNAFFYRSAASTPVVKKGAAKKIRNTDTTSKTKPTPVARPSRIGQLAVVTSPAGDSSQLRSILKGSTTKVPGRTTSPGHVSFHDGSRPGPTARHGRRASIATENALLLPPGYFTPREAKTSVSSSDAFLEVMAEYKEEQLPKRRNSTPDGSVALFPLDLSPEHADDLTENVEDFRRTFAEGADDVFRRNVLDVIGDDDITADRGVTADGGIWSIVHSWTPRRGAQNRRPE
ncbi:hypothetical protein LSAT2_025581 [Lamellibrachia satsuma]|nr:hypothetical protein LSAT2_025581 [Lamellibrachia satsuma]